MPTDEKIFDDAPIPDVPFPTGTDAPPETTHELTCKVCGRELEYSGRGRKPSYCPEHKPTRKSGGTVVRNKTNEQLAASATEALVQYNSLVCIGLALAQMPATAGAIAEREDAFREQTMNALRTDPNLCRQILKAGETSSKLTLAFAYITLAGAAAPYAVMEVKQKRLAKEAEQYGDGTAS